MINIEWLKLMESFLIKKGLHINNWAKLGGSDRLKYLFFSPDFDR